MADYTQVTDDFIYYGADCPACGASLVLPENRDTECEYCKEFINEWIND